MHHDAGDGVLLLLGHGLVDDGERAGTGLAFGHEVVRLAAEVERVDLLLGHEGVDVHRLVALGTQLVQLLGLDGDVLALGVLVPRDDLIVRDLAVDRAGLLVVDAGVAVAVELVQMNLAAAVGGGVRLDRDRDETELEIAGPDRTSHDAPFRARVMRANRVDVEGEGYSWR